MSDNSDAVSSELPISAQYQVLWLKKEKEKRKRGYAYIYSTEKLYSTFPVVGKHAFMPDYLLWQTLSWGL